MKTWHIIITGRVQGVGFRNFALDSALENEIKGRVSNRYLEKDVEIFCQGNEIEVKKFLDEMRKGPSLSRIKDFYVSITEEPQFEDFRIADGY